MMLNWHVISSTWARVFPTSNCRCELPINFSSNLSDNKTFLPKTITKVEKRKMMNDHYWCIRLGVE
jgi:hypothetical protein